MLSLRRNTSMSKPKVFMAISFYDDETVEHLSNGNVRVWVKSIKDSEFKKAGEKNNKKIIAASREKLVKGYIPPYAFVENTTTYDESIEIISWEEIANLPTIKPFVKIMFEINCKDKISRTLSTIIFNKDNSTESISEPGKWDYISPESTGETLTKILCKVK